MYRELVARGYTHSYWSVYEQLVRFLPSGRKNPEAPAQLPRPPVPARQAVFLFLRRASELEADEQETLAQLRSFHPEVDQAYELVQQFAQMLRTRTGEQLDAWLEKVRASQIRELQGFVLSVERDKAAVVAVDCTKVLRYQYMSFASSDASGIIQPVEPCEQAFVNKIACVPFTGSQCSETASHAH